MSESVDEASSGSKKKRAPDALAAVFDGTAAELLLIARHLTHDLHTAENPM